MSSIYLESVAILPQLTLLMRTENIDNLTGNYVFLLGAYRTLYIFNWIYRYYTETNYQHWLGVLHAALQNQLAASYGFLSDGTCQNWETWSHAATLSSACTHNFLVTGICARQRC